MPFFHVPRDAREAIFARIATGYRKAMHHPTAFDQEQPDFDPVEHEHAAARAAQDLQRIVETVAQRYLGSSSVAGKTAAQPFTWRALLDIEEQAFSDLGFQGRHEQTIIDAFVRLRDSRLPGPNLDEAVDWRRDDVKLPAVYLILRAVIDATAAPEAV